MSLETNAVDNDYERTSMRGGAREVERAATYGSIYVLLAVRETNTAAQEFCQSRMEYDWRCNFFPSVPPRRAQCLARES